MSRSGAPTTVSGFAQDRTPRRRNAMYRMIAVAALLAVFAPCSGDASDKRSLEEANRRWQGARCRSLLELAFKGGPDRDGVVASRWMAYDEKGGNHRARIYFENGEALLKRFRNAIPPGTQFTALGWDVDESGGSLFFAVELVGIPVRGRLYYWDDWVGKVGAGRLDDFERWVRFDVFEILDTPDERIMNVAGSGNPPPRPQGLPVETAPAPPSPQVIDQVPGFHVLAVSVEPARVAAGGELQLVIVYAVEGVPAGMALAVTERRSIARGAQQLTALEEEVHRGPGVHRSSLPLTLPGDLTPGLYELRATVQALGTTAEDSAVFEVTNDGR